MALPGALGLTMDAARWHKIEFLFDAALDLPAEQRGAFLDGACSNDPGLRTEVDSLLAAHLAQQQADAMIGQAVAQAAVTTTAGSEWIGRRIGAYEVTGVIGQGGMGLVLTGVRTGADFSQRVAIKLVHGIASVAMRERFRSERRILAGLEHPNIARLIDGGETSEGLPYLVMEYVDGVPIDRYCEERGLSTRKRLDLFRAVCGAVHDAHRHLVVHRDIKPGNILVTADGVPKLLDFGIARLIEDQPGAEQTAPTMRALTPEYASPEQVRGEPVTTASDIYSLGVLLYELLTGHRPYIIDTQQPAEIERIVCETDPERPSTAVTRERESSGAEPGAARPAPRRRLRRELAGDLDNIVLMAMRKEPERRYASVEQLSEDVRSHLRGFPVIARADSTAYRVSKFVRRHSLVLGALVAVFAALVIGLTMSISQHREAVRQRLVAEEKTREAQWEAYTNSIAAGEASILMNQIGDARSQLDDAPKHLRGWEWSHLEARLDRSVYVRDTHRRGITRIAFMPDGTAFATASMDGSVGLWQTASGDSVRRWSDLSSGAESVAISPDGTLIAAGLNDGTVIVWDTAAGNEVARLSGRKWAMVAFSPDGRRLGAGFQEGEFIEWQTAGWQKLGTIETGTGFVCPVYTRDGNSVLLGDHSGRVGVWNLTRRRRTMDITAHGRRVMNMALSGDGTLLATASMDRTAKIWRLSDGELVTVFRGHHATVAGIAFLNNEHVISTGADRAIFVWNANDGTVTAELRGGGEDAYSLAVSPDSASIVTGSWAGRVRLWARNTEDVRTLRIPQPSYEQFPASDAGVSPDGSLVASAAGRSQVCLWDARTGEHLEAMQTGRSDFTTCVVFGRNGSRIYAGDAGGHIIVFDTNTRRRLLAFAAHGSAVRGLDVSPDGTRLVSASEDSTIRFWDAALLAPRGELRGRVSQTDVVFGPQDGMASGSQDGTIRLWNTGSGDTTHVLRAHTAEITALAYSPDGGALASASKDETVRVWDATTGASLGVLATGRGRSTAVCFTPDGTRIAVGGGDQIVRILDPLTRRELSYLHGHVGRILALVPDPVRNGIVSASYDGTVRLWDAE